MQLLNFWGLNGLSYGVDIYNNYSWQLYLVSVKYLLYSLHMNPFNPYNNSGVEIIIIPILKLRNRVTELSGACLGFHKELC